jgi:hypothetical protein
LFCLFSVLFSLFFWFVYFYLLRVRVALHLFGRFSLGSNYVLIFFRGYFLEYIPIFIMTIFYLASSMLRFFFLVDVFNSSSTFLFCFRYFSPPGFSVLINIIRVKSNNK